jgi:GPH family glycoside/pentoside/hexuronide:cation symporter
MRYVSLMIAGILIPLSFWWTYKLKEPGFVRVKKQERTPFWRDMKNAATSRNFIFLTLTIFTLAMGFNFVNLLGSYIPIFYVFGGDKVEGAYLLGINGTVWAVTGVLAVFPLNWISPKVGKRMTLLIAILLMVAAQLSKIVCYNPDYPYLIVIPTVLLSAGMLFFFTLGSSMVGDICDEDDLKTGHRTEGSFYSIYWWFIKLGTALASFVAGALIVFTQFDETQVTKVDALEGSIRELRTEVESRQDGNAPVANLEELFIKARESSANLKEHLEKEAGEKDRSREHYQVIMENTDSVEDRLAEMNASMPPDRLERDLDDIHDRIVELKRQSPYTLLMMRVVEIGLPILLSFFSIFFLMRYALTAQRSQEIKLLLKKRNLERKAISDDRITDE